mgnify:CR=1 FL=1
MKNHKLVWVLSLMVLTLLSSCKKEPVISADMNDQFYVRRGGSDMPVRVVGNGSSNVFVLLLHGGPGDGSLKYRNHPFSDALEKDYAIAYWDQRHQGNSHGHLSESDITIEAMVEDTYAVIQTLKQRYGNDISVFLMGHSWGGLLGTAYMVTKNYQHEVKGWIESAGAHDYPLMNKSMITMVQEIAPEEITKGNHVEKWEEILGYVNELDPNDVTPEQATKLNSYAYQCEGMIEELGSKSTSSLGSVQQAFLTSDNPITTFANKAQMPEKLTLSILETSLTDELYKIQVPTLMLWGKYDFAVPSAIAEEALLNIGTPNKALKIYEESGHSSMRYQPEEFVTDVKAFIEANK